jgi:hypothetical protein
MKAGIILIILLFAATGWIYAQRECNTFQYQQQQIQSNSKLASSVSALEKFTQQKVNEKKLQRIENSVITIPVVVHILYHFPDEKIGDDKVFSQLDLLNKCFRKLNSDTINIPSAFKSLAADCEVEFRLATSDPDRNYTNGIIKKYTPVTKWTSDDAVKFTSEMGDDAWDPRSYLNIWVCNLKQFAGYSSLVNGPEKVDGIVIGFNAFGGLNKTIVHELGHWLNLKHIWGDDYCGDDLVNDTPRQASFTPGCPASTRVTCGNGPDGDMFNNYMDFTNDACVNMFTNGQKTRMKVLFEPGGPRYSLLFSKGLSAPLTYILPVPESDPAWLEPKIYPNPAVNQLYIDLSYDERWLGSTLQISNLYGKVVMQMIVSSKFQQITISNLPPGIYFIAAKRKDGVSIKQKVVKL